MRRKNAKTNLVHDFEELAILKNIWGANLNHMNEMITTMLIQNLNFHIVELVKGCLSAVKVKGIARRHLLDKMITMITNDPMKNL